MVLGEEIISEQDLTEFYEGYTITFNALSSTDNTFTGNLSYSWSLNPPDLDLIGSELSEVSFVAPEYIGQDKNYSLTLTVGDGTLESSVETDFTIEARMPIIGVAETEVDETEVNSAEENIEEIDNVIENDEEESIPEIDEETIPDLENTTDDEVIENEADEEINEFDTEDLDDLEDENDDDFLNDDDVTGVIKTVSSDNDDS